MNPYDEIVNLVMQMAQSQMADSRAAVWGYIANYDPIRHMVQCIIPTFRNADDTPVLSPWMQLGSSFVGPGYGFQVAPVGGATIENPTAGEQVKISLIERDSGVAIAAHMQFSEAQLAPFPTIAGGELGIKSRAGAVIYMNKEGAIDLTDPEGANVKLDGTGGVRVADSTAESFFSLKAGVFTLKADSVTWNVTNTIRMEAGAMVVTNHDLGAIIEAVRLASGAASSVLEAAR